VVSFVIPTYRRPEALSETLTALRALSVSGDAFEVIVVDDDADDATAEVVRRLSADWPRLRYIGQANAGAAAARNRGAAVAAGDLLIFLDDDILVEADHVTAHIAAQSRFPGALVNGHWEFSPVTRRELEATPFGRFRIWLEDWVKEGIEKRPLDGQRVMPSAVTAANLSVRSEVFEQLGGFDEQFPFAGYEDQDLSLRAIAAGHTLVYDRSIRLWHNDRRVSLEQFCQRQERGAQTAVVLAAKHPATHACRPLIVDNGPMSRSDGLRTMLKKGAKAFLAMPASLRVAHSFITLLERCVPNERLLRRLYWTVCGIYIFRGVRKGLSETRT
jgi:GT2 family glycosyltransferase